MWWRKEESKKDTGGVTEMRSVGRGRAGCTEEEVLEK